MAEALAPAAVGTLPRSRYAGALALMAASGFAGLGYQVVWTQQSTLWLGHETAAVLAVVAAFFGGLALGALALAPRIERSGRPARGYALCEVVIAVWGLVLMGLITPLGQALLMAIGPQPMPAWQWTLSFFGTFLLLLPATAAMGATFPALQGALQRWAASQSTSTGNNPAASLAALYAANTFGAVAGVLACAFWLVPEMGLRLTAALCVLLNLACAAAALVLFKDGHAAAPVVGARQKTEPARHRTALLLTLAATGLLGIGFEVVVVRVLSQVAENTVYTFALLLAVYLVGSAIGAALYARQVQGSSNATPEISAGRTRWLLGAAAAACLLGTASLWAAEAIKTGFLNAVGASLGSAITAEALLALAAFGLPTVVMGALFSHLAAQAQAAGISLGRALGVNTLGAALAPLVFGVMLTPALGTKGTLLLLALGYVGLGVMLSLWPSARIHAGDAKSAAPAAAPPRAAWVVSGALVSVIAAMAIWAPTLSFVTVPEGGRVLHNEEGAMAAVSVVEDAQGVSRLRINNRQQEGSNATRFFDARQGVLPLLLHPQPQRALFLGLGTGVTAFAAAEEAGVQVDAVELLPEVIAASALFRSEADLAPGGPADPAAGTPRVRILAADARRYTRAATQRYDVVVADNFHPARSGSGALYTVEHFQAVQARLNPDGGVFCQWLPLHQMDLGTLRHIVKAFLTVYPGAFAMLATNSLETPTLGLVATADGRKLDWQAVRERVNPRGQPTPRLAALGLHDAYAVLGNVVAGPQALARFAGDAAANTDQHPVVTYRAPRITYQPEGTPADRLLALLPQLGTQPGELLMASGSASPASPASPMSHDARLAAYWTARTKYLVSGRTVQPVNDVRQMLAQVQQPLLDVLQTSPDFRPAYDPLLRMAQALARIDPAAGRSLLGELQRVQPGREEAAQALRDLPL